MMGQWHHIPPTPSTQRPNQVCRGYHRNLDQQHHHPLLGRRLLDRLHREEQRLRLTIVLN